MSDISEQNEFKTFGLKAEILQGVIDAGFKVPSPIQSMAIPVILAGKDIIGQAHTGTGKTAAFGLPAMCRMNMDEGTELLVITPTRELATQVSDELYRLGHFAGIRSVAIYGGQSYTRQIKLVERGCQSVVATPGRLLDLLKSGKLGNFSPRMVVLDEADEMLDMGFLDDVKAIFGFLPDDRQTMMFSATMPKPIRKLADSILDNPEHIEAMNSSDSTSGDVEQRYYVVDERERREALIRLLEEQQPEKAIVFCRTRVEVDELCMHLGTRGFMVNALHGDMEQNSRNKIMAGFRASTFDLLIATDVAARGLDVPDVSHVFNYHIPFNTKSYIHRIGRTGRAGRKGLALTLANRMEYKQILRIRKVTGSPLEAANIPRLEELRSSRLNRLRETLSHTDLSDDFAAWSEALLEGEEPKELVARLLSLMLSDQTENGPDRIGLSVDEMKSIKVHDQKGGRGGSRRRSGGGGFRRGGGGGGGGGARRSEGRRGGGGGGRDGGSSPRGGKGKSGGGGGGRDGGSSPRGGKGKSGGGGGGKFSGGGKKFGGNKGDAFKRYKGQDS